MQMTPPNLIRKIRNEVRLLKTGRLEIDEFLRRVPGMRRACWNVELFCDWPGFNDFLQIEGFPAEHIDDVQTLWEDGEVISLRS